MLVLGLGLGLGFGFIGLGLPNPNPNPIPYPQLLLLTVRGGRMFAAEVLPRRTAILGKFFLADIFRANNSASCGGVCEDGGRSSAESAECSAEFAGNFVSQISGGSARNRLESGVSARIHASPPRKVFRRAYSPNLLPYLPYFVKNEDTEEASF